MTSNFSGGNSVRALSFANSAPHGFRRSTLPWRVAQYLGLLGGVVLVGLLVFKPSLGLDLLWNGFIPLAPALIVIAPGLWRNVCPMATFSLLPRRWGLSRRGRPSQEVAAALGALGLFALLIIIPLRHLYLNTNGLASAVMLVLSALIAFLLGLAYDWRSGWCNGLCPIHPAEKLYGQLPALSLANARCDTCHQCSTPCPDSTRSMQPLVTRPMLVAKAGGHIMTGGFVGFIWGWYRTPDYLGVPTATEVMAAYAWPFGAALITLAVYGVAYRWQTQTATARRRLVRIFAAAAVCAYYWYRIPALTGFNRHAGGMIWNLTETLPHLPVVSRILTTSFFVWFLVLRNDPGLSWAVRPVRAVAPA
jgi:hypothetical protein